MAAAQAVAPGAPSRMDFTADKSAPSVTIGAKQTSDAKTFSTAARFQKKLSFDSETTGKKVELAYGVAGDDPSAPAILATAGVYRGRMNAPWVDYLCYTKKVRMIFVDRPGIGLSSPVELSQRVPVWLEMVKHLLAELKLKHVAILSHSSGVIYALNVLYHMPEAVTPGTPIYMLSPWVHPSKSGVKMLTLAQAVPSSFMIASLVVAGFMQGWKKVLSYTSRDKRLEEQRRYEQKADMVRQTCGLTPVELAEYRNGLVKIFFAEELAGCNDETSLGLKVGGVSHWGICDDYEEYVKVLADKWKEEGREPLEIIAWFGADDIFIGKRGVDYFDNVWTSPTAKEFVTYKSDVLPGCDHDDMALPEEGYLGKVMEKVVQSHGK